MKKYNVLILGSGGREHALAWKISQSRHAGKLIIAPGNAGTAGVGVNKELDVNDFEGIGQLVREENIELLIYQTLFPIFQYKVGTETKPAGDIRLADGTVISEVDYVRSQIAMMPSEGGIVTPERHDIEFIGAEGKALKAREYLDYFKTRVLSGLGVSSVDMGEGDTANRATANAMSTSMIDSVKDFQDIIEETINSEVIKELLIESTFSFDVLDDENIVTLKFKLILSTR